VTVWNGQCIRLSANALTPHPYDGDMASYAVPTSLSPSRVESFTSCAMLFRFVSIEKIDDPPSIPTTRGSLVHRALQLAYTHPPHDRDAALFEACLDQAIADYRQLPDFTRLGLDDDQASQFVAECRALVGNYLRMENPASIHPIGLELELSTTIDGLTLRGVIDRLELRDGELVVTDYKTGRAPSVNWELRSLSGVRFYALLCKQVFGRLPAAVRLLYLSSGEIIEAAPSEQAVRFVASKTAAVWRAVERACLTGEFKPHPTSLCDLCQFRPWCPAFGGDPERAHVEAPVAFGLSAAA
jgi:putative RecB family exonuclease